MVPRHRLFRSNIVRNQGHFEPANNYQRYNVLHSGTIVYQEAAITARSAKKRVSYHGLHNLSTADLLFDEKKKKRRPASKSLEFFEAER